MIRFYKQLGLLLFAGIVAFSGCRKDEIPETAPASEFSAEAALEWNKLLLTIDRYAPGYRPPAAARMLAYMGLAAYEAAVPGMPRHNSMAARYPQLSLPAINQNDDYYWPSAVNAAYYHSFVNFYPHIRSDHKEMIEALYQQLASKYRTAAGSATHDRSKVFGAAVAEAVFNWSRTDAAGHEAYNNPRPLNYVPPVTGAGGAKLWQPTFPDFTPALFPYWGSVRTFAISTEDKIARPPIPWSEDPNSMFYVQAKEVKLWVDNSTINDRWIAEFWSDDIFELTFEPAARLISIGNQMVAADGLSLEAAVEFYAQMGMALCDVGIAVWHSKYVYNVERPVQYIRRVMDPNWKTILNNPLAGVQGMSPEFPAYPSGHSGFGGAGSAILAHHFGARSFVDVSHQGRNEFIGQPRTFNSFIESGVENAYSRLPLGVHFRMDCDEGLRLGYLAALRVIEMPWRRR
jgi:hypothetical protein